MQNKMILFTKKLFLIGIVFLLHQFSFSQTDKPCWTAEMDEEYIKADKSIIQIKEILEKHTREYIINLDKDGQKDTYIIPVVFHVVHNNGVENISKTVIEACVEQMNKDFSATNTDLASVINEFQDIIGSANIEIRLAQIDPDGNCTEGITRTQSEATYLAGNNVKFIAEIWDRSKYLNIWSVHSIGSGAAAYSNYPSSVHNNPSIDGVVSKYNYINGGNMHTISHEVGHYLNLIHPWGSTNSPDISTNCYIDDLVYDTPNTIGCAVGSCNLSQFTCESLDNVQNIMDYSGCKNMFTEGQVNRMHAALNSNISDRNNLWTEENMVATGTSDEYQADPCMPIADFMYSHTLGCDGLEVTFTDFSYNTDIISRQWYFPEGNPSESTDSIVVVQYENPGIYDVTLHVASVTGDDEITKNDLITIINTLDGLNIPIVEDFENNSFPVNPDDATKSWTIINGGDGNWHYNTEASTSGEGSVRIQNYLNGDGVKNSLISPNINLRNLNNKILIFNMAYAKRHSSDSDELRVYLSGDCGINWRLVYAKSGSSLSPIIVSSDVFVPEINDWKQESKDISAFTNETHVMLKFEMRSFGGNCLYIDDVKIEDALSVNFKNLKNKFDFEVFPNPINEHSVLSYILNWSVQVEIKITSILGDELAYFTECQNKGEHEIIIGSLISDIKAGIYFVTIISGNNSATRKIIVVN